jgi:uncharacterized protein YndB with AHSA1/START domain
MPTPSPAPQSPEVISTRVFHASRRALFEAFARPDHLKCWWGPRGFTHTFEEFDFRPGGRWRFTMHGPDGANYPNFNRFVEIHPLQRIVFDHVQSMHEFRMTMTFEESTAPVGTRVTWIMRFSPGHADAALLEFLANANEENLDRLQAHLSSLGSIGH